MAHRALTIHPVDGDPRIRDLDLAERLGFERPAKIRDLIKRNSEKLKKFNVLPTMGKTSGPGGGRPTEEYYLDQRQSIFICMKAETDNAFEVQQEIILVFDQWLNGTLLPRQQPDPHAMTGQALHMIADTLTEYGTRLDAHEADLSAHRHRINILENTVVTMMRRRRAHAAPPTGQRILDFESPARRRSDPQGGHHASPRPHQRRAHYRTLADGRRVEVREATIGRATRSGETLQ